MKVKIILLIAAITILLSSCLVNSLHPFYNEETIFFDKELIGTWLDQDSTKWTFKTNYVSYGKGADKKEFSNGGYTVRYTPKGIWTQTQESLPMKRTSADFDVFLFKINNQIYADFSLTRFPTFNTFGEDFAKLHQVNTHTLAKVIINKNQIELIWFNGIWLAELIENNRIKISHEFIPFNQPLLKNGKGQYVLTASTQELQNFIKKYGNDPNAFVRKREMPNDGFYTWNVGADHYTGEMTFVKDSISYNYNLKKLDDSKN